MDKPLPDTELLRTALAAVADPLGVQWKVKHEQAPLKNGVRADAQVRLRVGDREATYIVEVKRALRPATIGAVLHQLGRYGERALLVADHVTTPLADELRTRGVEFIDAAGNAFLNNPPLLVWVKGQRPEERAGAREPRRRAFQAIGLQVLFTLLCKPEAANWPYREIAKLADVAHGTVGWIMPDLMRLGYLAEVRGKRRLVNTEALRREWVEAYAHTLRPKLLLERYKAEGLTWAEGLDATKYDLLLGGEAAAHQVTQHLRPGTVTLYGDKPNPRLIVDHRLRRDAEGNVEILRRFWRFDGVNPGLVPVLLIYADLLVRGDARCLETAELIRERFLDRPV